MSKALEKLLSQRSKLDAKRKDLNAAIVALRKTLASERREADQIERLKRPSRDEILSRAKSRREAALSMRRGGKTFSEIATAFGVSIMRASQLCAAAERDEKSGERRKNLRVGEHPLKRAGSVQIQSGARVPLGELMDLSDAEIMSKAGFDQAKIDRLRAYAAVFGDGGF